MPPLLLQQEGAPSNKSWSFLSDPIAGAPLKSNSSKSEWFSTRPSQEARNQSGWHSDFTKKDPTLFCFLMPNSVPFWANLWYIDTKAEKFCTKQPLHD